jgi:hypothetical protein|tara:strand:+ start:440 stop:937 length:498 start_codon:yes stop_codon:yes gene_type:complete
MDVVLEEVTIIGALVGPNELSFAVLHSLLVLTLILGSIWPLLYTESVLFVLIPLTFISASVKVSIYTVSIGLVFCPLAFVDITFCMDKSAVSIGHTVSPESIVSGTIRPDLDTSTIFLVFFNKPFTLVDSTIFKYTNVLDFSLLTVVDFLDNPVEWLKLFDNILF